MSKNFFTVTLTIFSFVFLNSKDNPNRLSRKSFVDASSNQETSKE